MIDGIHVLELRPAEDGGSFKNEGSERTVPLHPAIIAEGFLDFVKVRGKGPLFYGRSSGDPTRKHASKGVSNRVGEWVRASGFTDTRKDPNHALRHCSRAPRQGREFRTPLWTPFRAMPARATRTTIGISVRRSCSGPSPASQSRPSRPMPKGP